MEHGFRVGIKLLSCAQHTSGNKEGKIQRRNDDVVGYVTLQISITLIKAICLQKFH